MRFYLDILLARRTYPPNMKVTPLNQDIAAQVGPDNYPSDWRDDITAYGLSRNESQKLYVVKLSVAGKQYFLGNAYSQKVGARLYDLALWKFAGKMVRRGRPNLPEEFASITQEMIDRDAPRLNTLYIQIPFQRLADEGISEEQLRAAALSEGFIAQPAEVRDFYLVQLGRLKRMRVAANANFVQTSEGHAKLALQKLPDMSMKFSDVESALAQLSAKLVLLEESMESQHDYYRKLKHEKI